MFAFKTKMNINNEQSDSYSIEKDKDLNQIKIKMAAKQVEKIYDIEDLIDDEIELSKSHIIDTPNTPNTPNKQQEKYHFSLKISKGHLIMSSFVSFTILLHAIYWEYTARSMKGFHHKWLHLQVSLSFSILNLLPSISIWLNIYSSFISIAVIIHSIWFIYHTFSSWIYNICSYNVKSEMCISVIMYKNLTLCLIAIVIFHQWLILLSNFRKYINIHYKNKIEIALDKAENLEIESTEMFQGPIDLETEAIDIRLETPTFNFDNNHSHKNDGCKYCFWDHHPTNQSDIDLQSDMDLHIVVPKSTKKHAMPIVT